MFDGASKTQAVILAGHHGGRSRRLHVDDCDPVAGGGKAGAGVAHYAQMRWQASAETQGCAGDSKWFCGEDGDTRF